MVTEGAYAGRVTQPGETRTATFLMTDIAGSTRLWEEQREAMVVALASHDAMLRAAVEAAGGTVFKTTGDGLLAAFERPGAAVRAALAGQRALQDHPWPTSTPLRVRMAIHAGDAEHPRRRLFRAIASTGWHGCSRSAMADRSWSRRRPRRWWPTTCRPARRCIDRGEHHLKDLARPEHVYQLAAPGLADAFPPLRSGAAPSNLPADLTTFIGRDREAGEIGDLLGTHRFVTLVGVGGTGKTRLMLHVAGEVANRHADGAWLVELAPLRDPELVASEVARALGIQVSPSQPAIAAVTDFLRSKDLLLLLDNCEHLIEAAAGLVEHLLATCRTLHVLATSREALGVPGEATFPCRRWPCPSTSTRSTSPRSPRPRRSACSSSAPSRRCPRSGSTTRMLPASSRSAGGSTASRSPWSSPRRAPTSCPPRRSRRGSATASASSPAVVGPPYPASRPCRRSSTGAGTS